MPSHTEAIRRGELPESMLAFPQKDVFDYDPKVAKVVEQGGSVIGTA